MFLSFPKWLYHLKINCNYREIFKFYSKPIGPKSLLPGCWKTMKPDGLRLTYKGLHLVMVPYKRGIIISSIYPSSIQYLSQTIKNKHNKEVLLFQVLCEMLITIIWQGARKLWYRQVFSNQLGKLEIEILETMGICSWAIRVLSPWTISHKLAHIR